MQQQRVEESDERVKVILNGLLSGKTREVMAKELGHANYKTIDMYMRRRNFRWDSTNNTYISTNKGLEESKKDHKEIYKQGKAASIISHLNKENTDVRSVAKSMGFSDHKEMASYMKAKGYIWDMGKNNYIYQRDETIGDVKTILEFSDIDTDISKYTPILDLLIRNKDRLKDILADEVDSEQSRIPRYIIPGVFITKSVHMLSQLDNMVRDFSREKNISQREIFEIALIQFFRRYGFEKEVKVLLGE